MVNTLKKIVASVSLALVLSACGGGGSTTSGGSGLLPGDDGPNSVQPTPTPEPTGFSALIEWDRPTRREGEDEGSLLLDEIGGYEIVYRDITENIEHIEIVDNQSIIDRSEFELTALKPGRYEFRIAVFDKFGMYSDYSETAYADIGM